MQWAKHDELTFGAIAPANILKRKDVALRNQVPVTIDHVADALVRAGDSVGRPAKENRQRRSGVLRLVELGVQLHAIAHGNHHFAFVEERAKVGALTLWSGSKTGHEQKTCQSEEKREAAYFTDGTH